MNIPNDEMYQLIDLETYDPNKVIIYENKKCCCCKILINWFLQIMVSLSLSIMIIIIIITKKMESPIPFIIFMFFYIIYIIVNLCSETAKILKEIQFNEGIEKILNDLFSQPPKINIYINCFDLKINNNGTSDSISYRKNVDFAYYSWKDVSGILKLGNNENKKYPFIKLYLDYDIYYADSMSIYDLNRFKDKLKEINKDKKFFSVTDNKIIPNFNKIQLICIDPLNFPCFVSIKYFYLFTFIPFSEFYKIYINILCYNQTFKIRKVISTRKDLNNDEKYNLMTPGLNYNGELIKYENTGNTNSNYELKEPTKEELDKSMEYNNLIPNFNINNIDEGIYIVKDIDTPLINDNTNTNS